MKVGQKQTGTEEVEENREGKSKNEFKNILGTNNSLHPPNAGEVLEVTRKYM